MKAELNQKEQETLNKWTAQRAVKKLLNKGGRLAIVWGPNTGLGVPVHATVRSEDGEELSINLTDYLSW